ncbi:MAG: zinc finger CCHC domain-containing protein [Sedimenticola sp.]
MGKRRTEKRNDKDGESEDEEIVLGVDLATEHTDDIAIAAKQNDIPQLTTTLTEATGSENVEAARENVTDTRTMPVSLPVIPPPLPQPSRDFTTSCQPGRSYERPDEDRVASRSQIRSDHDRHEAGQLNFVAEGPPRHRCWMSRSCEEQHKAYGQTNAEHAEYSRGAVTSYSYEGPRSAHDDASQGRPNEDRSHIRVPGATLMQAQNRNMDTSYIRPYQRETLPRAHNTEYSACRYDERAERDNHYGLRNPIGQQVGLREEGNGYRPYEPEEIEYLYHRPPPTSRHTLQGAYSQTPVMRGNLKLPAFTGKEDWKVWIRRFEAIAERRNWGDEDKLDELLPRLQCGAGEFVFTQLPRSSLRSYNELVMELGYRYRIIENAKSYAAKFAGRSQKLGETVEEYAAELKRLHYKAYPKRDKDQRKNDLVERFMRGIADDEVRFLVNFMKKPEDIDEAVFCVVECKSERSSSRYQEPYGERKMKKCLRRTQPLGPEDHSADEMDGELEDRVMRLNKDDRQSRARGARYNNGNKSENPRLERKTDQEGKESKPSTEKVADDKMTQCLQHLTDRIKQLEEQVKRNHNETHNNTSRPQACFKCGENGHYARWCPSADRSHNRRNEQQPNFGPRTDKERHPWQGQEHGSLNFMGRPQ